MKPDPQRIYLATGNAHKAQEFQQLAEASGLAIEFVRPPVMPPVVEDTGTFVGNARKKAIVLKGVLEADAWVLADDSGLCVDALGGAPGVESAYFSGPAGDSTANLVKLIDTMRGIPLEKRGARFVCLLVLLCGRAADEHIFEGTCEGTLANTPAGGRGFGYDPIFIPSPYTKTFADLGDGIKAEVSHRGRAFNGFICWLKSSGANRLNR